MVEICANHSTIKKNAPIRQKFDTLLVIFGLLGLVNVTASALVWRATAGSTLPRGTFGAATIGTGG